MFTHYISPLDCAGRRATVQAIHEHDDRRLHFLLCISGIGANAPQRSEIINGKRICRPTLMIHAILVGAPLCIFETLIENGASIHVPCGNGIFPIQYAAAMGREDLVHIFL
jgi:hypothetical protein